MTRELIVKDGRSLPGAARLLGLIGIKEDLNTVCDICLEGITLLRNDVNWLPQLDERGRTQLQAYYVAASITYARCFTGGVRTRLDIKHVRASAGGQADQAAQAHENLMWTRNQHLAHQVSDFEEGILGIVINEDATIYGLDPGLYRQTTAPDAFLLLTRLATDLLTLVNTLIEKQWEHLLAKADALTQGELAALPEAEWIPPSGPDPTRQPGEPRPIPEGGAVGYVRTVLVADDSTRQEGPKVGPDGPGRRRESVVVTDAGLEATWRSLGDRFPPRPG